VNSPGGKLIYSLNQVYGLVELFLTGYIFFGKKIAHCRCIVICVRRAPLLNYVDDFVDALDNNAIKTYE